MNLNYNNPPNKGHVKDRAVLKANHPAAFTPLERGSGKKDNMVLTPL